MSAKFALNSTMVPEVAFALHASSNVARNLTVREKSWKWIKIPYVNTPTDFAWTVQITSEGIPFGLKILSSCNT